MGRAAAIAYAREGADVVISYYPSEEPDAREVVELIRAEGRKAIQIPGDLREESYCKELVSKTIEALGGFRYHRLQRWTSTTVRRHPSTHHGSLRRHHEDQHLRSVLDHQGGTTSHAAGFLYHRNHV